MEHGGGRLLRCRECHGAEVAEHGVRVPAAEESDNCLVDAGTEQGSGPAGAKGVGLDFVRRDAGDVLGCCSRIAEGGGDVCGGYEGGALSGKGGVQRCGSLLL